MPEEFTLCVLYVWPPSWEFPEPAIVWSYSDIDGNPEGWDEAVADVKRENNEPGTMFRVFTIGIDSSSVLKAFENTKLKGQLK